MRLVNKTRYAILGVLLDGSVTGYEIKSLMGRSTAYFWRESDSTIYPMLKVLEKEGRVVSEIVPIGKKEKRVFSITEKGREEFNAWIASPTGSETPRNEFLLKVFFATNPEEIVRLFEERLEKAQKMQEEFREIEARLEGLGAYPKQAIRLKSLRYGITQLTLEIEWLKEGILEYVHR